jgi:hypothetical protein
MPVIESLSTPTGGNNDAGLKRTYFFGLAADVLTDATFAGSPTTYAAKVTNDATLAMKTGKRMWELQVTIEKDNALDSESQGEFGSLSAKNVIRGVQARVTADMAGWIEEHKNDELIFIVQELSGQLRKVGTLDLPAMIESFKITGGGKVSDAKNVSFNIFNVGRVASFFGTVATPLAVPLTPAA